jgi:hypothetical protein
LQETRFNELIGSCGRIAAEIPQFVWRPRLRKCQFIVVRVGLSPKEWEELRHDLRIESGRIAGIFQRVLKSHLRSVIVLENPITTDIHLGPYPRPLSGNQSSFGNFILFGGNIDLPVHDASLTEIDTQLQASDDQKPRRQESGGPMGRFKVPKWSDYLIATMWFGGWMSVWFFATEVGHEKQSPALILSALFSTIIALFRLLFIQLWISGLFAEKAAVPSHYGASATCYSHAEHVGHFPLAIAELKFGHVERQVFGADHVEGANDAALNRRPKAVDCLSVYSTQHVFAQRVLDGEVRIAGREVFIDGAVVSRQQANLVEYYFADELMQRRGIGAVDDARHDVALALDRAGNNQLAARSANAEFLISVFALALAADERFINFGSPAVAA